MVPFDAMDMDELPLVSPPNQPQRSGTLLSAEPADERWNLRGWPAAAAMWACNMFDAVCPTSDSPYIFSIVLTSVMAAS
jgi:hypothetical protein